MPVLMRTLSVHYFKNVITMIYIKFVHVSLLLSGTEYTVCLKTVHKFFLSGFLLHSVFSIFQYACAESKMCQE